MIKKDTRSYNRCHVIEMPEHLLMKCRKYAQERQLINNETIATLLTIKKRLESAIQYLRDTRVATRKWILGLLDMPEDDSGGWGDLERE